MGFAALYPSYELSEPRGSRSPDERSDIRERSDTAPDVALIRIYKATSYALCP